MMDLGPLLILFAAFLWSLDGLLRRTLFAVDASVVVFWEHLLGFLILSPFFIRTLAEFRSLSRRTWLAIGWVSLLSGVLGTFLYTKALGQVQFIQFSVVVLLQQLQPLFEISLAALVLKEVISRSFLIWAGLALVGAYLVSFPDLRVSYSQDRATIIAALLAVGAAFSWGSSTVFSKYGLNQLSHLAMTGIRFALTTVLAFFLVFLVGQPSQLGSLQPSQWFRLLTITLSTGMVALVIYYRGLRRTSVRVTAICELFWPFSAVAIDRFYFQRSLTLTQWLGALLLLSSILRVSFWRKSKLP